LERTRLLRTSCSDHMLNVAEYNSNGFDYPEGPQVNVYYPQFYHRTDKGGRPIYIEQLGKIDVPKISALTTTDRQLHHLVDEYEKFLKDRLPACSKQQGELVETSCTILDLRNAGISSFYRGEWCFGRCKLFF
jgi:hypothetical protein